MSLEQAPRSQPKADVSPWFGHGTVWLDIECVLFESVPEENGRAPGKWRLNCELVRLLSFFLKRSVEVLKFQDSHPAENGRIYALMIVKGHNAKGVAVN